jgi:hypothetical protein
MSATVIVMAEYRARRARVSCSFVIDPLEIWRSWFGFWLGNRRTDGAGSGVVRAMVAR